MPGGWIGSCYWGSPVCCPAAAIMDTADVSECQELGSAVGWPNTRGAQPTPSSLCSSPSSATPSPTHSIWTNSEWNAEQIIRLLVLEQFVAWLPRGTVGWIQWCQHMSLDKAVHLTEDHLVAIPGPSISLSPVPSPPLVPAPGKLRPWNWHLRPGVSPFSVIFQLSRMCYIYWCRTLIPFGRIGTVWLS